MKRSYTMNEADMKLKPEVTDPDKYKIIFENEYVKIYDYRDHPGERTGLHHHEHFLVYALEPFRRRLTLENGSALVQELEAGAVSWSEEQSHIGENIGETDTHVLIVELK
jgi:hypothetical protein